MATRKHEFSIAVLALMTLALMKVGCGSSEPLDTSGKKPRSVSVTRIDDAVLHDNGLETIWYNPPDGVHTIQTAELASEGLLMATRVPQGRKGLVSLLSRSNGEALWYFEIEDSLKAPPSVYRYPASMTGKRNEVFFSQMDTVYCVDLAVGDLLWKTELRFPVSTRVVADELHYFVGSDDCRAYGVKKTEPVETWSYKTGAGMKAAPVVSGNGVFFTSLDGSAYRFSQPAGFVQGSSWHFATGARIVADPVVYARWVVVGSTDYKVYCLESQDGTPAWSRTLEAPIEEAPAVFSFKPNQDYVYAVAVQRGIRGANRTLFSLKLSNGQEVWRKSGIRKVVSIGKSNVYAISDPSTSGEELSVIALDVLTGEEKFRIPVGGFGFQPLNSADFGRSTKERGRIFLIAEDGTVQVIGERT
jgi:outer membrane protein assembly factor BamB